MRPLNWLAPPAAGDAAGEAPGDAAGFACGLAAAPAAGLAAGLAASVGLAGAVVGAAGAGEQALNRTANEVLTNEIAVKRFALDMNNPSRIGLERSTIQNSYAATNI